MSNNQALVCAVCQKAAQQKCGACKSVAYCSKEHQKKDWRTHKFSCKPPLYHVEKCNELGRYLIASQALQSGNVICSEYPIIAGPKQITIPLCLGCYSPNPTARCPQCQWPLCSVTCPGRNDLRHHGAECSALAGSCAPIQFEPYDDTHHAYECITVLRCVLLQRISPRRWKQILEMEAHEEERIGTEIYNENKVRVVGFLRNFVGLSSWNANQWDVTEATLHRLCGVLDVNALEVRLSDTTDLQALYATAGLIEHSCVPNVRMTFDEKMKLTVAASLPISKGSHLQTMHTHALWGTQARREHLKQNKYFTCQCKRCADPTELGTYFSALRCIENCGDFLLPVNPLEEDGLWRCKGCHKSVLSAAQVSEITLRLADEVDQVLAQASRPALELLLSKLDHLTHPHHYHQYAVKHSLMQLMMRDGKPEQQDDEIKRKSELCEELLTITEMLDPGSARLAVYEAVICIEMQSVCLQIASKQKDNFDLFTRQRIKAKELLERAIRVLKFESPYMQEGRLTSIAAAALNELELSMKDIKLE